MEVIKKKGKKRTLVFYKGDDVFAELIKYCEKEKIKGAEFGAIGACSKTVLGYLEVGKGYKFKTLQKKLEVLSFNGNIAVKKGTKELVVHAHGSVSDDKYQVYGGHYNGMIVSVTLEMWLRDVGPLVRELDPVSKAFLIRKQK